MYLAEFFHFSLFLLFWVFVYLKMKFPCLSVFLVIWAWEGIKNTVAQIQYQQSSASSQNKQNYNKINLIFWCWTLTLRFSVIMFQMYTLQLYINKINVKLIILWSGDPDMAIQVSGVHKSYGRGSRKVEVLRNFNMTIPKGYIYGLLGKQNLIYLVLIFCFYED